MTNNCDPVCVVIESLQHLRRTKHFDYQCKCAFEYMKNFKSRFFFLGKIESKVTLRNRKNLYFEPDLLF